MEHCYIKSSKLLTRALMLFVIKDGKLCIFSWLSCFKQNNYKEQLPLALDWWLFWSSTWGLLFQLSGFEARLLPNSHYECKCGKDGHEINDFYRFLVMSFGLCHVPSTFITIMKLVFHDKLDEFIIIYVDDILFYFKSMEEHAKDL